MNEAEWLACTDPHQMLAFLGDKVSDRKLRLFICCCFHTFNLIADNDVRHAIALAEQFADGTTSAEDLAKATEHVRGLADSGSQVSRYIGLLLLPQVASSEHPFHNAPLRAAFLCREAAGGLYFDAEPTQAEDERAPEAWYETWDNRDEIMKKDQSRIVQELVGNPFRPVAVNPAWLTTTVVSLAEVIYVDRSFDNMPILADALEDAGCTDAEILEHCRQPGEHVRGCWLVDLLLGKE